MRNLPYAIINVIFWEDGFDVVTALSLFTLLTLNTLLDPLLYWLVGILNKKRNSQRKPKTILTLSTLKFANDAAMNIQM